MNEIQTTDMKTMPAIEVVRRDEWEYEVTIANAANWDEDSVFVEEAKAVEVAKQKSSVNCANMYYLYARAGSDGNITYTRYFHKGREFKIVEE